LFCINARTRKVEINKVKEGSDWESLAEKEETQKLL